MGYYRDNTGWVGYVLLFLFVAAFVVAPPVLAFTLGAHWLLICLSFAPLCLIAFVFYAIFGDSHY